MNNERINTAVKKNNFKSIVKQFVCFATKAIPVILPVLLVIHTNSTASGINGQPTPPDSLKKYRKF